MKAIYSGGISGTTAYLDDFGRWTRLSYIRTPPKSRGGGCASKVLRTILSDADREGVTLFVIVRSEALDSPHLDNDQLAAWYQRHGFTFESMTPDGPRYVRKPE